MGTARFAPTPTTEDAPAKPERKLKASMDWLAEQLADGQPHLAGGLIIRGVEAGHAERTLQRASKLLKVQRQPTYSTRGAIDGWLWALPAAPAKKRAKMPLGAN